jgi:hypothetical protein
MCPCERPRLSMRTHGGDVVRGRWSSSPSSGGLSKAVTADRIAVPGCCTALGPVVTELTSANRHRMAMTGSTGMYQWARRWLQARHTYDLQIVYPDGLAGPSRSLLQPTLSR